MHLTGSFIDYFIVFGSGVLVSFTPCVYPVVPITASFIAGANTIGTRSHGLILSLIYVFGMAMVYVALAVVAALTGRIFGQIQNSPASYVLIAAFLIFFALVMFDIIALPTIGLGRGRPQCRPNEGRAQGPSRTGKINLSAVFIMGMVSGLVVGPCTAPVLGSLLVYVASRENIIYGISLMFAFAYGVGFSLILVGTFSGLLSRLPKSGAWLVRIKKFCAWILLAIGIYFGYKGMALFVR